MQMRLKNWKLTLLCAVFIGLFIYLGNWQLERARQKRVLLQAYSDRTKQQSLAASKLDENQDLRFFLTQLRGQFDNEHTFLLDNKTFNGEVGYEIFTPFISPDLPKAILVDRGFVPLLRKREDLPTIKAIQGNTFITGMLNLPPTYVSFGDILANPTLQWPLQVEYIDIAQLTGFYQKPLYRYILTLDPQHPAAYPLKWQIVAVGPERHMGYALQWFAFALTLLILFVILNWRSDKKSK
jgi:surfeit locus 1 family protein